MKIQSELVKYLLIIKHEKEVERLSRHNDLWSVPFVGESNRLIGFVYEADQNKIKEAQDRVDELRHQETLDKIDEAIDAIEENKKNDNVYDYEGNQVVKDFGSVNVQALYASALENMDISGLLSSIISRSAQQNMDLLNLTGETGNPPATFTFGDFYLSGVNDTDGLAQAIVNELPNRILQRLYS